MAGPGLYYTPEDIALGLEVSGYSPRVNSVTQQAGLAGLAPSSADAAAQRDTTLVRTGASVQRMQPPPPGAASAFYNPTTNQMFAGGQTFDIRDVGSALQAQQNLRPSMPPGGGWQPLTQSAYSDYISGLAQPRGTGELLARGARAAVGGVVSGVGRGAEMLGATNVGPAIAEFGEAITGQDEFDQQRSALIQQRQSLAGNIGSAAIEAVPGLLFGAGAALGGAALGGLVAGPGGAAVGGAAAAAATTLARARTVGALVGLASTSFPQQLNTFYEAAANARTPEGQPAYDVNDPTVRLQILGGAAGTTLLDLIAPGRVAGSLSRAFTERAMDVAQNSVTGMARAQAVGAAAGRSAVEEAFTESIQTLTEQALFDPEFRRQLNASDWQALAPYIVERYGENMLIAAGAGALLGAGFGGLGRFAETRPRDVLQNRGTQQEQTQTQQEQQVQAQQEQTQIQAQGEMFPGQNLGATPPPASAPTMGGGIIYPRYPAGQGELFPGMEPSYAPPDVGVQGDLFAQGQPPAAQPAPTVQGDLFMQGQAEMFPGRNLGQAPIQAPEVPVVEQPLAPGVQRDLFDVGAAPVMPAPVVPQRPPVRAPETFIAPGMVRLQGRQLPPAEAPATVAETEAGNRLLALRRQLELQQAEAQRATQPPVRMPTAAELDFDRAEAQRREQQARAALAEPLTVDPASVMTSRDRGLNNARRNLIERFNNMTATQQNDVLVAYDNDPLVFQDAVARMDITALRQALSNPQAALARVRAAKPAAPKATTLKRGSVARAAEEGQVAEGRVEQRAPTDEGGAAPKAGGRDSTLRRGKGPKAEEVRPGIIRVTPLRRPRTAAPATTAATGGAAPRPLETAAPVRAEAAPAPAPEPVVETVPPGRAIWQSKDFDIPVEVLAEGPQTGSDGRMYQKVRYEDRDSYVPSDELRAVAPEPEVAPAPAPAPAPVPALANTPMAQRLNERIDRAASSRGNLTELRNDLVVQRERASDAGRSTTELTQAIDRIDQLMGSMAETDARDPTHPQSRWAQVMDDEGVGYNNLSALGRQEWDRTVASGVPLTPEVARNIEAKFPTEDTKAGLAFIQRLKAALDKGVDDFDRMMKITDQLQRLSESDNRAVATAARDALGTGQFSLADWNTMTGARNITGSKVSPVAPGRARMIVQNFRSKLATKPNITVVANQSELRRTNPALYARAEAARPQGDFATANAAGYSFADGEVIIFTDRIANEQHLRFVLAHETVGHFGMRGIMPGDKFNALMESIYDQDPQVRAAADAAMTTRGMSKSEAVEEYLSDYAGLLATNTVMRVWNAIKNFLSKLGVRFGDSFTRYFLDQSLRYVREGRQGVTFDAEAVGRRLHAVETGNIGTGRYSPDAAMADSTKANIFMTKMGAWPTNINETFNYMFGKRVDFANTFKDIKDKFFSLANYNALDNPGLYEFDNLMGRTNQITMAVKDKLNEYLRPVMDASDATRARISQVMYAARSYAIANLDKNLLRGDKLFSIGSDGNLVRNEPEVEKLFKAGVVSLEQIQKGFSYKFSYEGLDGKTVNIDKKFEGLKDFTKKDYELYLRARRAVMDVELELLHAEYNNLAANRRVSYRELNQIMKDNNIDKADKEFIDAYIKKYGEIMAKDAEVTAIGTEVFTPAAMKRADEFLVAVNKAFIGERTDRVGGIAEFFEDNKAAADKFAAQLLAMRERRKALSEATKFDLQNQIKQLYLNTHNLKVRETIARRGIATGYTPVLREGNYQMRLQAFVGNKQVEVKDAHQDLLAYSQFEDETGANAMRDMFNNELKDKEYELLVRNDAGEFVPTKVTLRATTGRILDAVAADPQLNLQEFLYGMKLFNINVNPNTMAKLVTTLSRQDNPARNRLEFSQTPGYDDTTGIYAISRHIEARASAIAKTTTRQALRELLNLDLPESRALWYGNEAYRDRLRQQVASATGEAKKDLQRQLDRAEHMFRMTNPEGRATQAMRYYNQAAKTMEFLDGSKFVDESNFGSGPTASRVRAYTSMMQLGGSIAQGALNLVSPYTNWVPYMSSYNQRKAFGGGFGTGAVFAQYQRAMNSVGFRGMTVNSPWNRADFYDAGPQPTDPTLAATWKPGIAQDKALQDKYGISEEEARVIAREIREGKLIPAQSNALMATARGQMTNPTLRKFADYWMSPFNLSEQAVRRAAFLASYRMFRDRALGAGLDAKKASERAREEAIQAIDLTLGEYSVLNRPPAWRDGIQSFLYMYKVYPTTVIQMLSRLSRPAQLSTLAAMWMLAGATGLPFAEDLEDFIDTVAQKLGFQMGSSRAAIIRYIEDTFPGMSPYFLRGIINQHLPADVASRVSAGNFLPGTAIGLAGADTMREFMDILGPSVGFLSGVYTTATNILALKSPEDIARESPVTALRILGDLSAYASSGAVVDRRGYVVSPEMDIGTFMTRAFGFYPERAATQYDIIRIAQRETDYQKAVVSSFRQSWIKAMMRGDTEGAREVVDNVRAWNESARGTTMEIRNFLANSQRALREARRGAGERALRAAPVTARQDIQGLIDAMTE